jgi:hypothetical protein
VHVQPASAIPGGKVVWLAEWNNLIIVHRRDCQTVNRLLVPRKGYAFRKVLIVLAGLGLDRWRGS